MDFCCIFQFHTLHYIYNYIYNYNIIYRFLIYLSLSKTCVI
nr:MAG TPA: hypothetical protein [Caudoviricetes sp.]